MVSAQLHPRPAFLPIFDYPGVTRGWRAAKMAAVGSAHFRLQKCFSETYEWRHVHFFLQSMKLTLYAVRWAVQKIGLCCEIQLGNSECSAFGISCMQQKTGNFRHTSVITNETTFGDQDFLKVVMHHNTILNFKFLLQRKLKDSWRLPQSCTKFKSAVQWSCVNVDCSTEGSAIHNAA